MAKNLQGEDTVEVIMRGGSTTANIEAEQAVLGAALYDNDTFEQVDGLRPEHFSEPFHGYMWEVMSESHGKGLLVEPIMVDHVLGDQGAYREMGALQYLADLVDRAPPAKWANDYAQALIGLHLRRRIIDLGQEMVEAAKAGHVPPAEALVTAEQGLYGLAQGQQGRGGFITFAQAMDVALAGAEAAYQRQGGLAGLSTGLIDLDAKLGGLAPSDLIVLAGRPSMGKTSLGVNIAYSVAMNGGKVGVPSLEMSEGQLAMRIIADRAGVSGDRIRKGQIDVYEYGRMRDVREELASLPIYIDPTGGLSIAQLGARARRLKAKEGLDLLIIDYLQLMTSSASRKSDNRAQEVSEITGALKALAKELAIPIIALSQLSRQVESRADKRPQLSDLRESGSIEQDADVVMFLYRESYYLGRAEPAETDIAAHAAWLEKMATYEGVAECIIGKARHGPIGTVKLAFDENLTRFGNLSRFPR